MKIIKNGYKREWKRECNRCKTIFSYAKNDTFIITKKERSGLRRIETHLFGADKEYIGYINREYQCVQCPMCEEIIRINLVGDIFFKDADIMWEEVKC